MKPRAITLTPFADSHGLAPANERRIAAVLQSLPANPSDTYLDQLNSADGCKALLDQLSDVRVARLHAPQLLTEQHIDWVLELAQRMLIHMHVASKGREARGRVREAMGGDTPDVDRLLRRSYPED